MNKVIVSYSLREAQELTSRIVETFQGRSCNFWIL